MDIEEIISKSKCFGYENGMWSYRLTAPGFDEDIDLHIRGDENEPYEDALTIAQNIIINFTDYRDSGLCMLKYWITDFNESKYSLKCIQITDCLNCGHYNDTLKTPYSPDVFYLTWWGAGDDADVWDFNVQFINSHNRKEVFQPGSVEFHHA